MSFWQKKMRFSAYKGLIFKKIANLLVLCGVSSCMFLCTLPFNLLLGGNHKHFSEITACGLVPIQLGVLIKEHLSLWLFREFYLLWFFPLVSDCR